MENTTQTETAETIINQINRLDFWARARWGVKEIFATAEGVQMNCNKRIRIIIRLDVTTDTYSVEIGRLKGHFDYAVKGEASIVMAPELVRMIDGLFSKAFATV